MQATPDPSHPSLADTDGRRVGAAWRAPREVLRAVFGHEDFRPLQGEVVDHVAQGQDALVLMPTGGGKSVCYQVPALARPGTGVVVSPLIALMDDQVQQLRQAGVHAAALTSARTPEEVREIRRDLDSGALDLLYVSPERLLLGGLLDQLERCQVSLFAIDEAHCVSQWGHDFRPDYRQLSALGERFPNTPRIAVTATADESTRQDIKHQLGLDGARAFVASFDRPNIRYRVQVKGQARKQLTDFICRDHPGESGIVYCMSRRKVEDTADMLRKQGVDAVAYHAGLEAETRANAHTRFLREDGVVVVATIAFGMGIDKPDVRFVCHLDLPKSLEAYYQETGRAGRDGLPAEVFMVYGMTDVANLRRMVDDSNAPEEIKLVERRKLESLLGFCETTRCRRQVLLAYFGETTDPCGNCDTCLEPVEAVDGTHAARLALSAVYRVGQSFGAGHVVDVLLGKTSEKVQRRGHDRLQVFGQGMDQSEKRWHSVLRQLVAQGLLKVDMANHGVLRLGPREQVVPVLRAEETVTLRADPEKLRPSRGTQKAGGRRSPAHDLDGADADLFESLRAKRRDLAERAGVPPYVVFTDATLLEMVHRRPRGTSDFARLPGVGRSKLERYADDFLAVLNG
ncbi:DNA helicase RecQ [Rhodovibrio salinarum]|uniref:DNA helicase RecQ n=1 Tax=Rhodovibrio salinarum TaxID=1087 RepID=A0A934QH15_9PROT|nr:DNA helicase RecQ [Rhodovibrio salinarum]MBK1696648.1 DNA helicase RecQ [Rhodovibrio salinarum]